MADLLFPLNNLELCFTWLNNCFLSELRDSGKGKKKTPKLETTSVLFLA